MDTVTPGIDPREFRLIRDYIEKHCGIRVGDEKVYLIQTRLTTLMAENGCNDFTEFYNKALADKTNAIRDRIIDAMTTNETYWFRDVEPYAIFKDVLLPKFAKEIALGKRPAIKIWSAACSTGQEPYSLAMCALDFMRGNPALKPAHIQITATDISPTVLFLARAARYDSLAMSRGLPPELKDRYFRPDGKVWVVKDEVKSMITLKKINLQESFAAFGSLDIVFCRNVLIYFSDDFKKDVLGRMAKLLRPGGFLILGGSESLTHYSTEYSLVQHGKSLYYQVK